MLSMSAMRHSDVRAGTDSASM